MQEWLFANNSWKWHLALREGGGVLWFHWLRASCVQTCFRVINTAGTVQFYSKLTKQLTRRFKNFWLGLSVKTITLSKRDHRSILNLSSKNELLAHFKRVLAMLFPPGHVRQPSCKTCLSFISFSGHGKPFAVTRGTFWAKTHFGAVGTTLRSTRLPPCRLTSIYQFLCYIQPRAT